MTLLLEVTNNATGSLDAGITAGASSMDVKAGEGASFPDTTGDAAYFYVTLQKTSGAWEIVKVTERATDTFTITRNVDSSTGAAQAFSADDIVSLRPVASIITDIITELNLMNPSGTLTAPSGTKLVFYQAAAPTGWTTDVAVADAVIAVKGGSNAYDDTAGTLVGTWTQPNHTHTITHTHETDHTHTVTMDAHNHKMQDYISGTTWKFFKSDGTSDTASHTKAIFGSRRKLQRELLARRMMRPQTVNQQRTQVMAQPPPHTGLMLPCQS
jgi:hypothetical protein